MREWRKAALAWISGILAFLILAGPWMGVLSCKYGHLTFSTVARVAHTIIGPTDKDRQHTWDRQLHRVPPGRITVWEAPDALSYNHWSPLENKGYFIHQVKYSGRTAWSIVDVVASYDLLRISLPALVLLPIIISRQQGRVRRRKAVWVLGTVAIYSVGFVFVFWGERYTHPFLFPLCCIYGVAFCTAWFRQVAAKLAIASRFQYLATMLVAMSFAVTVAFWMVEYVRDAKIRQVSFRGMAEEMKTAGCQGPVAILSDKRVHWGLYLAYHLEEPFAGRPKETDTAEIEKALNDFGVQTLVVASDAEGSARFTQETSWTKRLALTGKDGTQLHVYVPPADRSGHQTHAR